MIISGLQKFLFPDEISRSLKSDFIWNTMAGALNAAEAVVLLAMATRFCGMEQAGYLSIAFAVGNLFIAIGKYGVRHFQVTYREKDITLEAYRNMRVITTVIMLICCSVYILNGILRNGYSGYKTAIVFLLCIIYAIESMEDAYWGFLHREGRLAAGAKIFILRWSVILFVVSIGLVLGEDLLNVLLIATFLSIIGYLLCIKIVRKSYGYSCKKWDWVQIFFIVKKCTPLAIATFLNYYICNAPKYSIDSFMTDKVQAVYGYIAMPVFMIQLFSNFVFQPVLVQISGYWNSHEYEKFAGSIFKQYVVIVILTIVSLLGTYICGIQILGVIYGVDLVGYKKELLILMLGGGFLALDGFLNIILTVMDSRKEILGGYGICALMSLLSIPYIVKEYGIVGAVIGYCTVMLCLAVYFNFVVWVKLIKRIYAK